MKDLSIDPLKGNLLSTPLSLGLALLVLVPHRLLWGEFGIAAALRDSGFLGGALLFVGGIVAHEAIHGITWKLAARLKTSEIRYGVLWKALTPYAHPKIAIPIQAYRLGTAMPGVLLGLIPASIGVATGSGFLSAWGAWFLVLACGDLLILFTLRSIPSSAWVLDHPTRFGCQVLEAGELAR